MPERTLNKPGRSTIADIARAVGVSEATVSRALRGNVEISRQTRDLVERVARDLGYVPNVAARNLARRSSRTLGLIVPDVTDPVHGMVVAGFGRAADSLGYTMMVLEGSREGPRREAAVRTLREHQAQGVAFCAAPVSSSAAALSLRPAHAVFIMPEGTDAESPSEESLGHICANDAEGIRLLVEHLLAAGRSRLSYVNGPDTASNRIRRRAVIGTLEQLGKEPRIREYATTLARSDLDAVASLVARERPDALICYDDKMALHLLDALRQHGLDVPADVAVTGFDDIPFAAISNPRLTTVTQPAESLGATAAELLHEAIESGGTIRDVMLPVSLVVRESSSQVTAGAGHG